MKTKQLNIQQDNPRRNFIKRGSLLVLGSAVIGMSGTNASAQVKNMDDEEEEKEVSANEDLMREHGLLQRMMIIYDTAVIRMGKDEYFNPVFVNQTADIIRNFVEDYHEKLEEDYLFPRLRKANKETELVEVLLKQHRGGRDVTEKILKLTQPGQDMKTDDKQEVIALMTMFNRMYRPHEAREDTVLFPAFKSVVSAHEYGALGEEFEKIEHQKFGGDGFDMMVDKVAEIERTIGIYDLDQFTPHI
ncbi:hemerythrin domain-containing protein [Saccharicrinis sp. FJH54]|uniref:hemerythrin domain-containing protein n=1 Tax=Saccharicrinis sp. FJH54 TaxID=3344665 RepID=UPI0035D4367A